MTARIAILADTSLQRHILQRALAGSGYQVVFNQDPAGMAPDELQDCAADLWLVEIENRAGDPRIVLAKDEP